MTREETKDFLRRIKQHYQEFTVDDYKINEWHSELKNYDVDDVHKKLEEHLRSEQYGQTIPKVYFLTKYLKTTNEKQIQDKVDYYCSCTICGKYFKLSEYDKHFDRCSSVEFINKQCMDMKDTEIDKEKYFNMSDEEFNAFYDKLLKIVYSNLKDEMQKSAIRKYFETQ